MPSEPSPPVAKPKRPRSEKQRANDLRLKELWQARHAAKRAAPEAPKHASSDPPVAVPRSAGDPPAAKAPESSKAAEKPKPKSFFHSIGFS